MTPQIEQFVSSPYGFNVFQSPRGSGKTTALLRRANYLGSDDNVFVGHTRNAAQKAKQTASRGFRGLGERILFVGPSAALSARGYGCDGSILWDEAGLAPFPGDLLNSFAPMCVRGGAGMDITLTSAVASCWSGGDIGSLRRYLEFMGVIAHCDNDGEATKEQAQAAHPN